MNTNMKRIVFFLGSPRVNGNSERLAKAFAAGAQSKGAETIFFRLQDMTLKGCTDCRQCWTKDKHCIIDDDMTQLYESIDKSNVLVFVTPVYWYSWSAQIKVVWDRMLPYISEKTKSVITGKECVLLATAGDIYESAFNGVLESFDRSTSLLGLNVAGKICAYNVYDIGDIEQSDWLNHAKELGVAVGGQIRES
ncbi:MAG: flavodoxin family protein [Acetomicrobium sp.]